MPNESSFRFATVRFPQARSGQAPHPGTMIQLRETTFESRVRDRTATTNNPVALAARAVALEYVQSTEFFTSSALWAPYRRFEEHLPDLLQHARETTLPRFRVQAQAIFAPVGDARNLFDRPNAPRATLEDQLWSSFFAALHATPPQGSELARLLTWMRLLFLYFASNAQFAERANVVEKAVPLMPVGLLGLRPATETLVVNAPQAPVPLATNAVLDAAQQAVNAARDALDAVTRIYQRRRAEALGLTQRMAEITPLAREQGQTPEAPTSAMPEFRPEDQAEIERIRAQLSRPSWRLLPADFPSVEIAKNVAALITRAGADLETDSAPALITNLQHYLAINVATLERLQRSNLG